MKTVRQLVTGFLAAALMLAGGGTLAMAASTPTATKTMTITAGKKMKIKVEGTNIKSQTFKSTDTRIAAVDKKGMVTAKKAGNCKVKITVKYLKSKKAKKQSTKVLITKVTVKNTGIL